MTKKKEQSGPVLCIDGYNIRSGGGLSHLIEILNHYIKWPEYFSRIVILSSKETLKELPNSKYIKKTAKNNLISNISSYRFLMVFDQHMFFLF